MLVAGLRNCYTTVTTAECFAEALIGLFRDKRRSACCVTNERKRSVKAGGFGFGSFGKVRKR
ncbi:hypothetical protein HanRHA438_Chr13g0582181 [Helianthus annuus]|nr:hypothetical protein HanIR_Chr13g0621851 [Helianthus annuus]KAJ0856764.1 hypothetical protein HanRHA438_Chr13g0582181 [Helianthus annuus]